MSIIAQIMPTRGGVNLTDAFAAATAADQFANNGTQLLVVKNADASAHTVHIAIARTIDGVTPGPKDVVVAAGKTMVIGPFPPTDYNDGSDFVNLTYTATTSMSVAVIQQAVASILSPVST